MKNSFSKIITYLKESWVEIKKVNWPTTKETMRYSWVVLILSLAIGIFLGVADYIFKLIIQLILK